MVFLMFVQEVRHVYTTLDNSVRKLVVRNIDEVFATTEVLARFGRKVKHISGQIDIY